MKALLGRWWDFDVAARGSAFFVWAVFVYSKKDKKSPLKGG